MHPNTLRNKLSGVIAFPVTPFKDDLSLDLPGLHVNLNKLLEYPVSAIVAAGAAGEMYSLTPAEYLRVIELTALAVEDRRGTGTNRLKRVGRKIFVRASRLGRPVDEGLCSESALPRRRISTNRCR